MFEIFLSEKKVHKVILRLTKQTDEGGSINDEECQEV